MACIGVGFDFPPVLKHREDMDGLNWLAKDRAMVPFADATQVWKQRTALEHIVRQWIRHV
jgi:hypothetical protein